MDLIGNEPFSVHCSRRMVTSTHHFRVWVYHPSPQSPFLDFGASLNQLSPLGTLDESPCQGLAHHFGFQLEVSGLPPTFSPFFVGVYGYLPLIRAVAGVILPPIISYWSGRTPAIWGLGFASIFLRFMSETGYAISGSGNLELATQHSERGLGVWGIQFQCCCCCRCLILVI